MRELKELSDLVQGTTLIRELCAQRADLPGKQAMAARVAALLVLRAEPVPPLVAGLTALLTGFKRGLLRGRGHNTLR